MKEQPLVSVIIPVYNVERYLAQCLDSVINQTYPNLEIICVNDGSRDGSPDILRRYADEDARIQVIDKANGGVSRARNDALDCARGEYIMFVDSDDWVEPDACENAVNAMREYDADIVMWSYVSETENRSSRKVIFPETTVFEKEEVRAKLHRRFVGAMGEELSHPELVDSLCPVWGKLYRRSLIQKSGARFVDLAEIGSYEDGFFNLEVFGKADRVVYLAAYLYHYRRDGSSSVTSGYNPRLYDQWQTLYDRMEAIIRSNQLGSEYEAALNNRIALGILGLGLNITVSTQSMGKKVKVKIEDLVLCFVAADHQTVARDPAILVRLKGKFLTAETVRKVQAAVCPLEYQRFIKPQQPGKQQAAEEKSVFVLVRLYIPPEPVVAALILTILVRSPFAHKCCKALLAQHCCSFDDEDRNQKQNCFG